MSPIICKCLQKSYYIVIVQFILVPLLVIDQFSEQSKAKNCKSNWFTIFIDRLIRSDHHTYGSLQSNRSGLSFSWDMGVQRRRHIENYCCFWSSGRYCTSYCSINQFFSRICFFRFSFNEWIHTKSSVIFERRVNSIYKKIFAKHTYIYIQIFAKHCAGNLNMIPIRNLFCLFI